MRPSQRKSGQFVVVETPLFPVIGTVTGLAAIAVVTLVNIVLLVTTDAGGLDIPVVVGSDVAVGTTQRAMFIQQREAGLRMIEIRHPPCFLRRVTALAVHPQGAAVTIVILMATNASLRRILEVGCFRMAGLALDLGVSLLKFETRPRVVESGFAPASLGMAITTGRAQRALMLVIGLVARVAGSWKLQSRRWRSVAALASRRTVFAT